MLLYDLGMRKSGRKENIKRKNITYKIFSFVWLKAKNLTDK